MRSTHSASNGSGSSSRQVPCRTAASITEVSSLLSQPISQSSTRFISLPESACGPKPFDLPTSRPISRCGPAVARVSRTLSRASSKARKMIATCGPRWHVSWRTELLQSSLESRLREALDSRGAPEFDLTWKPCDMPSGLPICRLQAWGRRTRVKGYTGALLPWPTVTRRDFKYSATASYKDRGGGLKGEQLNHLIGTLMRASGATQTSVALNPDFASWLMLGQKLRVEWDASKPTAMRYSPRWLPPSSVRLPWPVRQDDVRIFSSYRE